MPFIFWLAEFFFHWGKQLRFSLLLDQGYDYAADYEAERQLRRQLEKTRRRGSRSSSRKQQQQQLQQLQKQQEQSYSQHNSRGSSLDLRPSQFDLLLDDPAYFYGFQQQQQQQLRQEPQQQVKLKYGKRAPENMLKWETVEYSSRSIFLYCTLENQ